MSKAKVIDLPSEQRLDGWSNLVTSMGTGRDKRMQNQVYWEYHSPEFFEQMYAGDELASRIVNVVPEEALRKGWEWNNVDKNIEEAIQDKCADLDLRGAVERAWKWGRAYGGAVVYIVTDTTDPASPLEIGERVIGLRDLSRYDLRILTTDVETDFGSPNWGNPRIYYLVVQMGSQFKGYPIHWTRMVRFDGYMVPRRTYIRNNYWHDSVLNRLYNSIRNYQTANDSVATMLQDFNVDVYKMKNLANLMAAGKESVVKARLEMMSYSKSIIRALLLDSDEEEYENAQRSVDGVAELLTKQANRLVAATDIPHTKLLGESPDGSNATGNSTTAQWHDHVQSEQENYLRPRLQQLIDCIFFDIPKLGFKFKSLYQLTELEQADLRLKVAQADQIYLSTGVLDPSEVAESRFGGEEYSIETDLDEEAREQGLIGAGSNEPLPQDDGQENFGESSGLQPPEGISKGPPPMYQPEGSEESKETAAFPESLQKFEPNPESAETSNPGTQFDFRNQDVDIPEKTKAFISQTMSEPMRDPKTDPKLKPGGRPNHPRTNAPSRGNSVTAPSGNKFRTDSGESVNQVGVVALIAGNKLLMGKRADSGKWVLPGGNSEGDETPVQTASRELKEETGIEIDPSNLKPIGQSLGKTQEGLFNVDTFIVNLAEEVQASGAQDPDEEVSRWEWIDISNGLPPEIVNNLHHENIEPFKQLGVL